MGNPSFSRFFIYEKVSKVKTCKTIPPPTIFLEIYFKMDNQKHKTKTTIKTHVPPLADDACCFCFCKVKVKAFLFSQYKLFTDSDIRNYEYYCFSSACIHQHFPTFPLRPSRTYQAVKPVKFIIRAKSINKT